MVTYWEVVMTIGAVDTKEAAEALMDQVIDALEAVPDDAILGTHCAGFKLEKVSDDD